MAGRPISWNGRRVNLRRPPHESSIIRLNPHYFMRLYAACLGAMRALSVSAFQHAAQQLDILGEGTVKRAQFIDLAHGVHNRGVVAPTEFPANFRQ